MAAHKIWLCYTSITGNTKKLAEYLAACLKEKEYDFGFGKTVDMKELEEAELYIMAFWCRRSGVDDVSQAFLEKCSDKNILAIGTMSGDSVGNYGKRVNNNVRNIVGERNNCVGVWLCQGSADLKRIQKRMLRPKDDPFYVSPEKYQTYVDRQSRPDESDLKAAAGYVLECIEKHFSHS